MIDPVTGAALFMGLLALSLGIRFGLTRLPACRNPAQAFSYYLSVLIISTISGAILGSLAPQGASYWSVRVAYLCLTQFALGHTVGYLIKRLIAARRK